MSDDKECKSCALLRRYEKTARERGYAMGKAAGNNELAQAQELLAAERKAHAETNTALTAEITRLEAQLAAAAPGAVHPDTNRLDAIAANCWKLDPFDIPNIDDADIGWRVVQYHMGQPRERTVARVCSDDPRAAIDEAMKTE